MPESETVNIFQFCVRASYGHFFTFKVENMKKTGKPKPEIKTATKVRHETVALLFIIKDEPGDKITDAVVLFVALPLGRRSSCAAGTLSLRLGASRSRRREVRSKPKQIVE